MSRQVPNVERVGVVVLAYGSGREYEALLESLSAEGIPPSAILVVHNPAEIGEAPPPVPAGCEALGTGRNLGYAGGMNRGVARLSEREVELVLLLTHDARLRPGALEALLGAADRFPRCGIFGPALVFSGSDRPFSFGGTTDSNGANSHRKEPPLDLTDGVAFCDWVDGGSMLVRREVFDRVGDFDERFWGYCEEADLCLRARRAGYSVGVAVDAKADQDPGASKRLGAWAYLMTRNGLAYARRAAGSRGLLAISTRSLWVIAINLIRAGLRTLGLRPGSRSEPWAIAVGTGRGAVDYLRGHWGPPPPDLPGIGDLSNA